VRKSSDQLLNLQDYDDYVKTAQRLARGSKRDSSRVGYETLVRGELPLVDKLLDQLQSGAFYALELKVLKAMVISVHFDKDRPQDVLERYTYTFTYRTSPNGLTVLNDITLKRKAAIITTFDKAKLNLDQIVRQSHLECRNMPCLPEKRHILVRLFYNDDWDPSINIPGFRTDSNGIAIGEAIGWTRSSIDLRNSVLDTGYHGSVVRYAILFVR
jgi:meiosis-specific protein HOP1